MNACEARAVLLLRRFEDPVAPPWSDADAAWADEAAKRSLGDTADGVELLAERARLALPRLASRVPGVGAALNATAPHRGLGAGLVIAAFIIGLMADSLGGGRRIDILAPPLLALLVWNVAVYFAICGAWAAACVHRVRPAAARHGQVDGPDRLWRVPTPWREALLRGLARLRATRVGRAAHPALLHFVTDWGRVARPLLQARIATVLHLAALALAAGAVTALYLRGLAFEYRAGWDSTFLGAAAVQRALSWVLGPASALSGIPLPQGPAGIAELDRLRWSAGDGENAARWIHLQAITVLLVIGVPRAAAAGWAAAQARRRAARLPVPLADAGFARVLRRLRAAPLSVALIPYSCRLDAARQAALAQSLRRSLGAPTRLQATAPVPLGGEDAAWSWPATPAGHDTLIMPLYALTATPERENHGAFLAAVRAAAVAHGLPASCVVPLVDTTEFRERFTGAAGATREAERRAAWQRLFDAARGLDAPDAVFLDLGHHDLADFDRQMHAAAAAACAA